MTKTVFCKKYQENLPSLEIPPMPGELGIELQKTVSAKAWEEWKSHQVTLINEKMLDMSDQKNRKWLIEQMHLFFDNADYAKAEGFKSLDLSLIHI